MTGSHRPGLTGSPLDRADHIRHDEDALAEARRNLRARLLRLEDLHPALDEGGELGWGSIAECDERHELLFLGFDGETPCFCALDEEAPSAGQRAYSVWRELAQLPAEQAAIYGTARGLIEWHRRHRFCGSCGGRTRVGRGGWQRTCDACGAEQFPRIDPVVIMLAEHEGRALVGRQPRFPPRSYSALAGFVEPGESLEEAVARELKEEAGVETLSVRYMASQPWPFPGSLMIGCIAPVADPAITLDPRELEDARWVGVQDVRAALARDPSADFAAPPPFAIAHTLLRAWAEEQG